MEITTNNPAETLAAAEQIYQWFVKHRVRLVLLKGDLGAGKTLLVKGIVEQLGGHPGDVTSPTFTLHNTYDLPNIRVDHYDLYRLEQPGIMLDELYETTQDEGSICLVEWPATEVESLKDVVTAVVDIQRTATEDQRLITVGLI